MNEAGEMRIRRLRQTVTMAIATLALSSCDLNFERPTEVQAFIIVGNGNGVALAGREVWFYDRSLVTDIAKLKAEFDNGNAEVLSKAVAREPGAADILKEKEQAVAAAEKELAEQGPKDEIAMQDAMKRVSERQAELLKGVDDKIKTVDPRYLSILTTYRDSLLSDPAGIIRLQLETAQKKQIRNLTDAVKGAKGNLSEYRSQLELPLELELNTYFNGKISELLNAKVIAKARTDLDGKVRVLSRRAVVVYFAADRLQNEHYQWLCFLEGKGTMMLSNHNISVQSAEIGTWVLSALPSKVPH